MVKDFEYVEKVDSRFDISTARLYSAADSATHTGIATTRTDSEQQRIPLRIGTAIGPGSLSLPIHARNRQEQHPAQRVTGLDSLDIENI